MTLVICRKCGWFHIRPEGFADHVLDPDGVKNVWVCTRAGCRGWMREATDAEIASVPVGCTVCGPRQDVPLVHSRRFYESRGSIYDSDIDSGAFASEIMDDADAEKLAWLTEGYLLTITPMRAVDVVLRPDLLSSDAVRMFKSMRPRTSRDVGPLDVDRDDPVLVEVVRRMLSEKPQGDRPSVVTIPASWGAGESPCGWSAQWCVIRLRNGGEIVSERARMIDASGVVSVPGAKSVVEWLS